LELTNLEGFLSLPKVEDAIKQANSGATAVDCGGGSKKIRAAKPGEPLSARRPPRTAPPIPSSSR